MTRYTDDSRDRVRDAVDMVALVSARTELRRAGVNSYFGLCPFHQERSGLVPRPAGREALPLLRLPGLRRPVRLRDGDRGARFQGRARDARQPLRSGAPDRGRGSRRRVAAGATRAAPRAARQSGGVLRPLPVRVLRGGAARDYLRLAGFTEETLKAFRVGYAPSAWDRMLLASRKAGFSDEELLAVGLAQRSKVNQGRVYDRFRERIMFPAADARGRVLGFGARAMRDNQPPKYLNTSDGELYHKRSVLFGVDLARPAAAKAARMILVEGYTDVLALHQAGLTNAVAIMGTSLTEEQVAELERIVGAWDVTTPDRGNLDLCLDADRAGQEAMLRAAQARRGPRPPPAGRAAAAGQGPRRPGAGGGRGPTPRTGRGLGPVRRVPRRTDPRPGRRYERGGEGPGDRRARSRAQARRLRGHAARGAAGRISGRLELSEGQARRAARGRPSIATRRAGAQAARRPRRSTRRCAPNARSWSCASRCRRRAGARSERSIPSPSDQRSAAAGRPAPRGQTEMPLSGLAEDDEDLAHVMADLVERAGRAGQVTAEQLEQQRLLLERARLERAIRRAREQGGSGSATRSRARARARGDPRDRHPDRAGGVTAVEHGAPWTVLAPFRSSARALPDARRFDPA